MIEYIFSPNSPAPTAPYSPAVRAGDFIYISGQAVLGDVQSATREILTNIRAVLEAGGASLDDVVSVIAYLADIDDWGTFNATYKEIMKAPYPSRTALGASLRGILVEVSAVAYVGAKG